MKQIWLAALLLISANHLFADLNKAPDNFSYQDSQAVFVDFTAVTAVFQYDISFKRVMTAAQIEFEMPVEGYPLFDATFVSDAYRGESPYTSLPVNEIPTPDGITELRVIDTIYPPGTHKINLYSYYEHDPSRNLSGVYLPNLEFLTDPSDTTYGVNAALFTTETVDRNLIEQYLPTNFQFDQYPMTLYVSFSGYDVLPPVGVVDNLQPHTVFTNGVLTELEPEVYKIDFANYSNASAFYFHIVQVDELNAEHLFNVQSVSGATIPVVLYSLESGVDINQTEATVRACIEGLEDKIAPFPFSQLVVNFSNVGNSMEYSGAIKSNKSNLCHEVIHQYFGRSVFPVGGDDGWIDEAIASLLPNFLHSFIPQIHPLLDNLPTKTRDQLTATNMGNHSQYFRKTDGRAYSDGENFMAYLNNELQPIGGLYPFLSHFYTQYAFQTITTEIFEAELEAFSNMDFSEDFDEFVYGIVE